MKRSLKEFTTRDLVVTHWLDGLDKSYMLMQRNRVRHLPVVDDGGAIIGIISDRDFHRAMHIDQPDFASGKVSQPEFDPQSRVRDFMSWPVAVIHDGASVSEAAKEMIDKKISALLITRGDQVVGIVTTEDLLRALVGESVRGGVMDAIYRSPIGPIANALANIGV